MIGVFSLPKPKAQRWAYSIGRSPLRSLIPTLLTFFSEITEPIKAKFHVEPLQDGGTKVCIIGPGHMTRMAAMPIYGKNLKKKIFFSTTAPIALKLSM